MAKLYIHTIKVKANDVREEIKSGSKYKTVVIESTDTNAEMYEKVSSLMAFEKAVSVGFHLSIETKEKE